MIPRLLLALTVPALLVAWLVAWAALRRSRKARRARLHSLPAAPQWGAVLRRNAPVCSRLPKSLRPRLAGLMHVFLDEKRFEGCGGLEMTDEIRVTVAAQACILLLGGVGRFFPHMRSIFVYPAAYGPERLMPRGDFLEEPLPRLGESWYRGPVVLAWDAASHHLTGFRKQRGNVVLHEFAHQLDQENGWSDGTPVLPGRPAYDEWARVFHEEFEAHCLRVRRGEGDVLDPYGATNPAEFFAVATEAFFERSEALHRRHPSLYHQLRTYYDLDPAGWQAAANQAHAPAAG